MCYGHFNYSNFEFDSGSIVISKDTLKIEHTNKYDSFNSRYLSLV